MIGKIHTVFTFEDWAQVVILGGLLLFWALWLASIAVKGLFFGNKKRDNDDKPGPSYRP